MSKKEEPRIRHILMNDVKESNYSKILKRDFLNLKEFMLSEEKQKRLDKMHTIQKTLFSSYWLFRELVINLTPARRLLFVVAIIFTFLQINTGTEDSSNGSFIATLLFVIIIMLELKDKLLLIKELEGGQSVQAALMPVESPEVNGWDIWLFNSPASEVGGDLVDYSAITEHNHYAAIGDVSGKGLSAALLAIKLQATLRAVAGRDEKLDGLGKTLNQIFCRDCLPHMFASLIYVEFKHADNILRVLNAGHFPPVIIKNNCAEKYIKGGAALGLHSTMRFFEQNLTIDDDDLILLYTDGLTEARNENGEFFGEERLLQYLPKLHHLTAAEAGRQLLDAVEYFSGDAEKADDISLVFLRRKK